MKKNLHWFSPSFGAEEKKSLLRLIDSNFLNEGKVTRIFENKFSKFLNVKFSIATTSGTVALALSLMGLGIKKNDEVIIPNFTFVATANAVTLVGAKSKFIDIKLDDLTLDEKKLEKLITQKTKAVITVDVNGRSPNYLIIERICKKYGLKLICDSSEALGSMYQNQYLGSYGHCGCFSFSAAKTLSTGQGGMIVTNDINLRNRIYELKDQGRASRGTGGKDFHPALGFNFKYTDLQATVGIQQLKKVKKRIINYKKRDKFYRSYLNNSELCLPIKNKQEVLQWFDIVIFDQKLKSKILMSLKKEKIGFREFWDPVNSHFAYKTYKCMSKNSNIIAKSGIWLPSNFDIQCQEIEYVCNLINQNI